MFHNQNCRPSNAKYLVMDRIHDRLAGYQKEKQVTQKEESWVDSLQECKIVSESSHTSLQQNSYIPVQQDLQDWGGDMCWK